MKKPRQELARLLMIQQSALSMLRRAAGIMPAKGTATARPSNEADGRGRRQHEGSSCRPE
jgi:hypothetical protein